MTPQSFNTACVCVHVAPKNTRRLKGMINPTRKGQWGASACYRAVMTLLFLFFRSHTRTRTHTKTHARTQTYIHTLRVSSFVDSYQERESLRHSGVLLLLRLWWASALSCGFCRSAQNPELRCIYTAANTTHATTSPTGFNTRYPPTAQRAKGNLTINRIFKFSPDLRENNPERASQPTAVHALYSIDVVAIFLLPPNTFDGSIVK